MAGGLKRVERSVGLLLGEQERGDRGALEDLVH
jgi:hypothetical protein